jgi:predicted aspartyl protease
MIVGRFGDNGELFFELELVAVNGESFPVEGLLDTGFTTGWLAINSQDLDALEWPLLASQIEMRTAQGDDFFDLYKGTVILDGQAFTVPIHVGDELDEILIGSLWLEVMELVANKPRVILTLEIAGDE